MLGIFRYINISYYLLTLNFFCSIIFFYSSIVVIELKKIVLERKASSNKILAFFAHMIPKENS